MKSLKTSTVAVLVLSWNGLSDTIACVESLKASRKQFDDFDLFLLDNASDGDEYEILKERLGAYSWVHLFRTIKNLGFAGGNNFLIEMVKKSAPCEFIFFLNNDTSVAPDFLKNAVVCIRHNKADILASKMIDYFDRKKIDSAGHDFLTCADFVPRGRGKSAKRYTKPTSVFGACAGGALFRSELFRNETAFDDTFFLNYEDVELTTRLIIKGAKCIFCPNVIIFHKKSKSLKKVYSREHHIKTQRNLLWTYFSLAPWGLILLNLPAVTLQTGLVTLMSLILGKWEVMNIFWNSRWRFFRDEFFEARRRYQAHAHQNALSFWEIWLRQKNFLPAYWDHFRHIVLLNKKATWER